MSDDSIVLNLPVTVTSLNERIDGPYSDTLLPMVNGQYMKFGDIYEAWYLPWQLELCVAMANVYRGGHEKRDPQG